MKSLIFIKVTYKISAKGKERWKSMLHKLLHC